MNQRPITLTHMSLLPLLKLQSLMNGSSFSVFEAAGKRYFELGVEVPVTLLLFEPEWNSST